MDGYSAKMWIQLLLWSYAFCLCVRAQNWDSDPQRTRNLILHDQPKYLVLASNTVRPGQVYRVCVSVGGGDSPIRVRASLHRDGEQVVGAVETADPQQVTTLLMQVPFNAIPGSYRLKVEGDQDGRLGGSEFSNETLVAFSEKFLTILIQTNQLVYNLEQMMYIRIILLTTELKPFTEPIDVYIVDSRDVIMKRWVSVYPLLGMVNLEFELPYDYPEGWWTIRAVALGQKEETRVLLERWFSHRFDVNVGTPAFILDSEEALEGQVLCNYTSVATVTGNMTIRTLLRPLGRYKETSRLNWKERYLEEYVDLFHGTYDFSIPLSDLRRMASPVPLENCEIEVQARVGERFYDFVVTGYGRIRVVNSTITLKFLGSSPQVFKPGMPFKTHIVVSYHDLVPLSEEKLRSSHITVNPTIMMRGRKRDLPQQRLSFEGHGVIEVLLDIPKNTERVNIQASYEDDNDMQSRSRTDLTVLPFESRHNRFLQISSSTKRAQAGEYAVFHVRSNFYIESFDYLVSAKGIIVQSGSEKAYGMVHSITTFSIPVSPEMAPVFHIVVYHITMDGEVLTDSLIMPVDAINKHKFVVDINMKQERSGNNIEFIPRLTSECNIGLWGFDSDHLSTHGRQQLTITSINEAMYNFEKDHLKFHRAFWRHRDGSPEEISYYTTPNVALDTKNSFEFSNLVVFTNLLVNSIPNSCDSFVDTSSCFAGGQCYPSNKKCDGIRDCDDGSDEGSCSQIQLNDDKELFEFYLYRRNRQNAFYDATAGNFAWKNKIIGEDQEEYVATTAPKGPSAYAINAVGMNKKYGLHILPEYKIFDSTKPFFIIVEGPGEASIGEQIGLRVSVMNFQFIEIKAEIILAASDSYRFVEVEPLGIVSSYNPRTSGGELQHLIYVKPVSHAFVHVPVVATAIGEIEITIIGRTQVAEDVATFSVNILPDGVIIHRHTSMLLDMRNEAYLMRYLDVNVTEDPIIPYEETYRRYIAGSTKATVTLIGDVVGAPFPTEPKSPVGLHALRVAEAVKSGEHIMFDFAYTLYTLHYLRLTNQLTRDTLHGMLEYLNKAYVYQSVFFKNGAFSMFKGEKSSLWLTAYCARIFHLAQYADWENYLFIDPNLLTRSVEYILRYQTREGSFYEITDIPWNRKLNVLGTKDRNNYLNITLTAQVLITLTAVSDLPGDIRVEISNAKSLAVRYLERRLPNLHDPYQVAIVTYALLEAGSVEAEVGFNKLDNMKREKEGLVYWSPEPILSSETLYQNQRPFILPRLPNKYDSVAVEATAYALLVYVRYNGAILDQIVKWLNTMRTTDEAFISSQDTIVAMEALVEYSFRTHVRDITNMKVSVESSSNPGKINTMDITNDNLAHTRTVPFAPFVWGHAEVIAKGAGLSLLQMDVQYNVDKEFLLIKPPVPSFDLTVKGQYHGRNKSHMAIRSCARWTLTEESETSGVAVVEISLPTGYFVHKPDMDKYVYSRVVPRLQRGRVFPKSAVFMFNYLDTSWSCVDFTVQRWYPVANMTRFLKAKVYDYYTPERYKEIIYDDFDLYVLNICEVCGSYQCPYCPYFSYAERLNTHWIQIIAIMIVANFLHKNVQLF